MSEQEQPGEPREDSIIEFSELAEHEQLLARMVRKRAAPGREAARSAIVHIQKAYRIAEIDPEMAAFRAITAEEEAARAILHALQRLRYDDARRLDWQDHRHKAAVVPFLDAIGRLWAELTGIRAELHHAPVDGEERLVVHVEFTAPGGQSLVAVPAHPLNFQFAVQGRRYEFANEVEAIASEQNVRTMLDVVKRRANLRNQILYATSQGVSGIDAEHFRTTLPAHRATVFTLLSTFLLIDQSPVQQLFAIHALRAFLRMLGKLPPLEEPVDP